jgi:hypothetical protein
LRAKAKKQRKPLGKNASKQNPHTAAESGWAAAKQATRIKKKKMKHTPTHTNDFALERKGKGEAGCFLYSSLTASTTSPQAPKILKKKNFFILFIFLMCIKIPTHPPHMHIDS